MRDLAGFDPLTQRGLRAAGLDPEGGIAGVSWQLGGKSAFLIAYSVIDVGQAQDTINRIWSKTGKVEVVMSESDPRVTEIRREGKQELVAAYMLHRGHLWVAPADTDADPLAALADLKTVATGLTGSADYQSVAKARQEPGGVHLFLSQKIFQRAAKEEGLEEKLSGILGSLRADLDIGGDGVVIDARLGLTGPKVAVVAGALQARNQVPAFESLVGPDRHLLAKFSVDLLGLAKALVGLSGQANVWTMANAALDQLEKGSGLQARRGFLENLGDNFLLSIQLNPGEILTATAGGGSFPGIGKMLQAVLYAQLKDADLFAKTVDSLTAQAQAAQFLKKGKPGRWTVGPAGNVSAAVGGGFLILATSGKLVDAALQRLEKPGKKIPDWPATMAKKDHQLLVLDIKKLLDDLTQAKIPQSNFAAQMNRSLVSMATAKLGSLGIATLDSWLAQDALSVQLRLTLR